VRTYVRGKGEGGLDEQEEKSDSRRERERERQGERERGREGGREGRRKRERESNITAHTFIGSMGIYWSGY